MQRGSEWTVKKDGDKISSIYFASDSRFSSSLSTRSTHLQKTTNPPKRQKSCKSMICSSFAERTRFELVVGLLLRQFSKLVVSATHPSLQYFRTLTLQIRTFKILSQSTMRFSQKHCKVSALIGIYQMFLLFFITQKYHFSTTMTKHVDYQSNLHIAFFIIL